MRRIRLGLPSLCAALTLIACGDDTASTATDTTTSTSTATSDTDAATTTSQPDTEVAGPADGDQDGDPDATDCAPDDPTRRHGAVERPGNAKDDDCDGQTDEAAAAIELRPVFMLGLIGQDATSVAGTSRVDLAEGGKTWTDVSAVVTPEGSSDPIAAEVHWLADSYRLSVTMPLTAFDLVARNPAHFQIAVTAQSDADTFTDTVDFVFSVLPDRVGMTFVDGALYGIVSNPAVRFRNGSSLFVGTNFDSYGPSTEVAPGIWSFTPNGAAPVPTSYTPGVPSLLYFTAGEQSKYGSEAYISTFTAGPTGAGFVAYWGKTGTTPLGLVFFELTDHDNDDAVHVSDLDGVDPESFDLGTPPAN